MQHLWPVVKNRKSITAKSLRLLLASQKFNLPVENTNGRGCLTIAEMSVMLFKSTIRIFNTPSRSQFSLGGDFRIR